jgi:uncharacterized damage-inducible protein DinB
VARNAEIAAYLDLLAEAFDRKSWHGTNLLGSIRGMSAAQALWRPARGRHSIWEIAVHAAYWKYAVRRQLTGGKRGAFALQGSNWFAREAGTDADWKRDVALLKSEHKALVATVEQLAPIELTRLSPKGRFTMAGLIRGAAAHDLYHAGQIQVLKRLASGKKSSV